MATDLLYLKEFDVTTCAAKVVAARTGDDGRAIITLDQTCFYPRGGGQDWDTGTITQGSDQFTVQEVRLDEAGNALHIGQPTVAWPEGSDVACRVDETRRAINTRLHSAGHVVDMAISQLRPAWVPTKGAHYPHMSFVEYETDEQPDEAFAAELEAAITKLLQRDYQNKIMFVPVAKMGKYCRHVPANIPANKPSRIVLYADDFGIPCGGTHVRMLSQIGAIHITKVKAKKGIAKVTYTVEGIN